MPSTEFQFPSIRPTMNEQTPAMEGLERRMSIIFTRLQDRELYFPDDDIEKIRDLLTKMEKNSWSARPRIYSVLRMIGKEKELMDEFVKQDLFDIGLPYDALSLPLILRGPTTRRAFLKRQAYVLTDADKMEKGSHAHLANDANTHFEVDRELGRGGFGAVQVVTSNLSYNTYARKTIQRRKKFGGSTSDEESFRNEFQNLKRLSHHHLVQYIGSYTDPQYFGILLLPIGECDLKEYLGKSTFAANELRSIRQFFGCITSGVEYLHRNSCRHKDIKPGNILIKKGVVYIADFGLAYDWTDKSKSKTEGMMGDRSINYMAPEVAAEQPRGSAADMWSLGCIFLDMITVLKGETIDAKKIFFEGNGSKGQNPRQNEHAYNLWMEKLKSRHDDFPWLWTKALLARQPDDRLTAIELLHKIQHCNDPEDGWVYYCLNCDASVEGPIPIPDLEGLRLPSPVERDIHTENITITDVRNGVRHAVTRDDQSNTRLWLNRWARLSGTEDCQTSLGSHTNALHIAARQGNSNIAQDLLKYGFDVNAIAMGSAPLHLAVQNGNVEVMQLLVEQGADTNAHDEKAGATALHLAAQSGFRFAAKFLVEHGASVNALDKSQLTPLHLAALSANEEVAAVLLDHPGINVSLFSVEGLAPLHLAALHGRERIVGMLLDHGIDIDTRDSAAGNTALHCAAGSGKKDVVGLLVRRGAQVNIRQTSKERATPLHFGVFSAQQQVVEELLKGNIDPEATDLTGATALHLAAYSGYKEIASLLLANGFDVNKHVNDPNRAVPLAIALQRRDAAMARLFLDNHANTNITGPQGETTLHGLAAQPQGLDMVELLLGYNPDINVQDRDRNSPLMIAASLGNGQIAQKLLEKGANTGARNINYMTALHLAAQGGHVDVVETLVKHSVNVNAEDQEKRTPLHVVSATGNIAIAFLLINAGAKVDVEDRNQHTPLWYAEDNGYTDLVELLKAHAQSSE